MLTLPDTMGLYSPCVPGLFHPRLCLHSNYQHLSHTSSCDITGSSDLSLAGLPSQIELKMSERQKAEYRKQSLSGHLSQTRLPHCLEVR